MLLYIISWFTARTMHIVDCKHIIDNKLQSGTANQTKSAGNNKISTVGQK